MSIWCKLFGHDNFVRHASALSVGDGHPSRWRRVGYDVTYQCKRCGRVTQVKEFDSKSAQRRWERAE